MPSRPFGGNIRSWATDPATVRIHRAALSAIAAVYTSKFGFAIGADGRASLHDYDVATEAQKQMESEREQKVFEAQARRAVMAYAITGTAYSDDGSFSVIAESQKAAASLSEIDFANYREYFERFCQLVSMRIDGAHKEDRFDYLPAKICAPGHENTIVRFLFCGYFRKEPFAYDAEII